MKEKLHAEILYTFPLLVAGFFAALGVVLVLEAGLAFEAGFGLEAGFAGETVLDFVGVDALGAGLTLDFDNGFLLVPVTA